MSAAGAVWSRCGAEQFGEGARFCTKRGAGAPCPRDSDKGAWDGFSGPYLLERAHSLEPSLYRVLGGAPRSSTSGGAEAEFCARRGPMPLLAVGDRFLKHFACPSSPRRRRKSTSPC